MNRTEQPGPMFTHTGPADGQSTDGGSTDQQALAARAIGLGKTYGRTQALSGVNLEIPTGSVLGLLGPNGSGKTTLIRLLLGLTRPTEGSVWLLGTPMPAGAASVLPQVGALVEGPGFLPFLSGRANLTRLAAAEPQLSTRSVADAVDAALRQVGLHQNGLGNGSSIGPDPADRAYRRYCLGMRQRLGVAATLLAPRRLVVLDEPTTGLDPAGTRMVRQVIAQLRAGGTTVVLASHALAEVEQCCTHIAVLSAGAMVAAGSLTDLLGSDGLTLSITTSQPVAALTALRSVQIPAYLDRGQVVADVSDSAVEQALRTLIAAGVAVSEVRRQRVALEELFIRLTEDGS